MYEFNHYFFHEKKVEAWYHIIINKSVLFSFSRKLWCRRLLWVNWQNSWGVMAPTLAAPKPCPQALNFLMACHVTWGVLLGAPMDRDLR